MASAVQRIDISDDISSRSLVLGMVGTDGRLVAHELYDIADACGFTVHQIRLCLARLVDEGVLAQTGRGRKAIFNITARGRQRLEPEVEFLRLAWAQDAGLVPWEGTWHLVSFSIAEDQRHARNSLRDHLTGALAGAAVHGGLYVQANPWEPYVRAVAEDLGVGDRIIYATAVHLEIDGRTEPREVAAALWDLDGIARAWQTFIDEQSPVLEQLRAISQDVDPIQPLAAAVGLVAAFNRVIVVDPLVPKELLPDHWPGESARELLVEATDVIGRLRSDAQIPTLFSRFDLVMNEAASRTSRRSAVRAGGRGRR